MNLLRRRLNPPPSAPAVRLHHGHGLALPAPHASAAPLHLRLPHLVHALAHLLLEREVLRALKRREKSGELLLFLFLEVDALSLGF